MLVAIAGGGLELAARLGGAMLAIQFGIGALNDLVDAARDLGLKPGKPIPAGTISGAAAGWVAGLGLVAGLLLAATVSPLVLAIAGAGAACGVAYDLRLKGTAWSWLPFALGIPLLVLFAWLGGAGRLPPPFVVLLPMASVAGCALAIGNALADVERDSAVGTATVAVRLGPDRAWRLATLLYGIVVGGALAALGAYGGRGAVPLGLVGAAVAILAVGAALGRGGSPGRRERAWELQAIGTGLFGAGWLWALATGGAL